MQWGYAVGTQYAVGVSTKRSNSHSGVRSTQLVLVQKGQLAQWT